MTQTPLSAGYYYDSYYPYGADFQPGYPVHYDRGPYAYPYGVPTRATPVPPIPPDRYQMIPGDYRDEGYGYYPFVPEQRNPPESVVRPSPVSSTAPTSPASSVATNLSEAQVRAIADSWEKAGYGYTSEIVGGGGNNQVQEVRPTGMSSTGPSHSASSASSKSNLTDGESRQTTESWPKTGSEFTSTTVDGGPSNQRETETVVNSSQPKSNKWRVQQRKAVTPLGKDKKLPRSNTAQDAVVTGVVQPPANRGHQIMPPNRLVYQPVPGLGDYYGSGPAPVPYEMYPYRRF